MNTRKIDGVIPVLTILDQAIDGDEFDTEAGLILVRAAVVNLMRVTRNYIRADAEQMRRISTDCLHDALLLCGDGQ